MITRTDPVISNLFWNCNTATLQRIKLLHLNHIFLKKCWLCATFLLSLHPETV